MKDKVYLETSVISYLAARMSRDLLIAAHQQVTHQWWNERRQLYHLVASELVVREAEQGSPELAAKRLDFLRGVQLLGMTADTHRLARVFVEKGAIPASYVEDALHIAMAVTNGVTYLLTWNCKHIANAIVRRKVELISRQEGFEPATICTPDEL